MNAARRRKAFALLLPPIALLSAVGIAEAALRIADIAPQAPPPDITSFDPRLGWRNTPGASGIHRTRDYTVRESIDSLGFRGPELTIAKPAGVRRIALLGDSFVDGYTTSFETTAGEVLERQLNAHDGKDDWEVINAGTAGYSTDQELLLYRESVRRFKPDEVILLFYVNDVWYNDQSRYWRGRKPKFVV
jgi:hypothetical protein